jgi:hypothetical protein
VVFSAGRGPRTTAITGALWRSDTFAAHTADESLRDCVHIGAGTAARITFAPTPWAARSNAGPNLSSRSRNIMAGARPAVVDDRHLGHRMRHSETSEATTDQLKLHFVAKLPAGGLRNQLDEKLSNGATYLQLAGRQQP